MDDDVHSIYGFHVVRNGTHPCSSYAIIELVLELNEYLEIASKCSNFKQTSEMGEELEQLGESWILKQE